jgi:hypothetical protein
MPRTPFALFLLAAVTAGCGTAKSSDQAEKEALERRVAELEQRLAERESAVVVAEASAPPVAPAPVRREPVRVAPKRAPEPRVAATPAPEIVAERPSPQSARVTPTPVPVPPVVIAEGTTLDIVLETPLSSKTSHAGDEVVARIQEATGSDGETALPGGSYLEGRVVSARESGRVKGKAQVDVTFDRIVVRGQRYSIETTVASYTADDSHKRDAAIVAGSAAAGALLGKITGGSAGKGAVLGGAAGGGAVLATKGKEIEVPAGSPASVRVTRQRVL